MCSNGNAYIQPCAPGSKNSPQENYQQGDSYYYHDFCDVNLVDDGYTLMYGYSNSGIKEPSMRKSFESSVHYGENKNQQEMTGAAYGGASLYHGQYQGIWELFFVWPYLLLFVHLDFSSIMFHLVTFTLCWSQENEVQEKKIVQFQITHWIHTIETAWNSAQVQTSFLKLLHLMRHSIIQHISLSMTYINFVCSGLV